MLANNRVLQVAWGTIRNFLQDNCTLLAAAIAFAGVLAFLFWIYTGLAIVLLGAHLDSWDKGTGAIDDGTGVAIMLEVARLILALPEPPRRTIRVVLFANEEFGLSGARAYPKGREAEIDQHVLAMEADLGAGRVWRYRVRTDDGSVEDAKQLIRFLAPMGVTWSDNIAGGGADLIPLRYMGVPMVDLRPDATHYFDYHHTDDDTLDKVDPTDLAQNVASYVVVAYWAAEREGTLGGPPVEELPSGLR